MNSTLSVTYTPENTASDASPDLLMLEQKEWKPYNGTLTRANLARYIRGRLYGGITSDSEVVDCGWGETMIIVIYAYKLRKNVQFRLVSTVGELGKISYETITEKETVSFEMEKEVELTHPAKRIISAEWLTGPYTTGGVKLDSAQLSVDALALQSQVPLFGSVWLTLEVERATAKITVDQDEALPLLASGWSEYCVGLPFGGKPVALEIAAPPGAEELAEKGQPCGRGSGSATVNWPDDDGPPTAQKADKRIKGDYCSLELTGS